MDVCIMKLSTLRILYWVFTLLLASFMLFSGVSELMQTESAQKALTDLGYPVYLNLILGVAKILGAIAIVQTKFTIIKEWAYAGFTIDFIGAGVSIALSGGEPIYALVVLPFLIVLFVSYALWKKCAF